MSHETCCRTLGAIALIAVSAAVWMLASGYGSHNCPGNFPSISLTAGRATLSVEIAANENDRFCGLAHRDHLPPDRGMLFVYAEPQVLQFWMKDTRIPLSIAFIDDDRRIREIFDMQPNPSEKIYRSMSKMRYALETNRGWFDAHGVVTGDEVLFKLPADLQIR